MNKTPSERLPLKEIKWLFSSYERLKAWTIQELEAHFDLGLYPYIDWLEWQNREVIAQDRLLSRLEREILAAARTKDRAAIQRITEAHPELESFALREWFRQREAGREPGDPRKHDLPLVVRNDLMAASQLVDQIRDIWWRKLRRRQPWATQIAAELCDVNEDQLIVWRDNHRGQQTDLTWVLIGIGVWRAINKEGEELLVIARHRALEF
jgi:hypothetical protein